MSTGPLPIGTDAPDFEAQTTDGPIHFHEWLGSSWGVIFSHPKDFTPVCTTELGYMARIKPEFDRRNVKIIGLSIDPVERHAGWAADIAETQGTAPNYPMIGDTDLKVAKLYGMLPAGAGARARVFEALATAMTDVYAPFNALFHIQDDFPGKVPDEVIADFDKRIRAALTRLDERLAKSEWIAGDFSIADIALYCNVWRLKTALNRTFPDLANLQRWFTAIANRPGVQLGTSLAGRP